MEEFTEAVETETQYISPFDTLKEKNEYGLTYNNMMVLPPQFEGVGFLLNDFAVVRGKGGWGMLTYDTNLKCDLIMHDGEDVAFRHRNVNTKVRLVLPAEIPSEKCDFTVGNGCKLGKI